MLPKNVWRAGPGAFHPARMPISAARGPVSADTRQTRGPATGSLTAFLCYPSRDTRCHPDRSA
jgi:hypothetical protein